MVFFLQSKCAHYWPDPGEVKEFDGIKLTHQKEVTSTDFTLREFLMSMDGEERVIYQYHFQVDCEANFVLRLSVRECVLV